MVAKDISTETAPPGAAAADQEGAVRADAGTVAAAAAEEEQSAEEEHATTEEEPAAAQHAAGAGQAEGAQLAAAKPCEFSPTLSLSPLQLCAGPGHLFAAASNCYLDLLCIN